LEKGKSQSLTKSLLSYPQSLSEGPDNWLHFSIVKKTAGPGGIFNPTMCKEEDCFGS